MTAEAVSSLLLPEAPTDRPYLEHHRPESISATKDTEFPSASFRLIYREYLRSKLNASLTSLRTRSRYDRIVALISFRRGFKGLNLFTSESIVSRLDGSTVDCMETVT